jgi:hypothetical protein
MNDLIGKRDAFIRYKYNGNQYEIYPLMKEIVNTSFWVFLSELQIPKFARSLIGSEPYIHTLLATTPTE